MQELVRTYSMDEVSAIEILDRGPFRNSQFAIKTINARVFKRHPFINSNCIIMPSLHHKGSGRDEGSHLCVIERRPEVPFWHFMLPGEHITPTPVGGDAFQDPFIKITGAD